MRRNIYMVWHSRFLWILSGRGDFVVIFHHTITAKRLMNQRTLHDALYITISL